MRTSNRVDRFCQPIVRIIVDGEPYEFLADRKRKMFQSVENAQFYLALEDVTDGDFDDVLQSCQVREH